MHAVGYGQPLPIEDPRSLVDIELPRPVPLERDLLVRVSAVAVNPVDTKVRRRDGAAPGGWKVLGWDAVGVVEAVGARVSRFRPGDRVWYAGALDRDGCNAEWHRVDERLVAVAPTCLDDGQAAALPLTAITAWELLFDRLRLEPAPALGRGDQVLVVGAAGGVGSIAIQLLRQLTGRTVIATASRPESQAWVRDLGAHHVIDHHQPLRPQLEALGFDAVQHVVSLTHTDRHFPALADLLAPQGALALIDDPDPAAIDLRLLKKKSLSLHWEFMFTRSLFQTADMDRQGALLERLAQLVLEGRIRSTLAQRLGPIDALHLRRAHALVESHTSIGKVVLEKFP
jgi:zinc-binding alcohol dehydrogenase family protein